MKYIILRRNTGDLDLEGADTLHLSTMYYDLPEYKNFPRRPKEPKRIPAPDYGALGGQQAYDEEKGWVWQFPDEESEAKAEALAAEYKPKQEANYAAYQRWLERLRAWETRRTKAAIKAMRKMEAKDQRYSFAGGSSKGVMLARRLRFLRAADQRRFDDLDRDIQRLQRRRAALIERAFERGIKPTPEQLFQLAIAMKAEREREYKRATAARPYKGPRSHKDSLDSKWRLSATELHPKEAA